MYGAFLQSVRESRGLTQVELAELVGIKQPNLSAYERDRRLPTIETLNRILVACGYRLTADGGSARIHCALPRVGWFPDDDDPPALADDPVGEPPVFDASTPLADRGVAAADALRLAEATR